MDFPARLKQLRQAAGLTQEALALKCGWSGQSRVGNYEAGRGDPKFAELPVLAAALGVPVGALFEDPEPSHAGRIDPSKLATSIHALRQSAEILEVPYDPVENPVATVKAYELALALSAEPSTAEVIDFSLKVAEILRKRGGGGHDDGGPGVGKASGGGNHR